ncbi:MAG TPA: DUF433 domain-containing protein [Acidobacteriota bacterium]|nr:DUF433 domain-containing protein [Acidobacteriota bacterium]
MKHPMIESVPDVMMGRPVIKGTRLTVELILDQLAAGESIDDLLKAHPRLTHEGIRAALAFAADVLREELHPLAVTQNK